jgi:hypothetical protein
VSAVIYTDLRGLPEVEEMLEQFQGRELNNRTRRAVRAGAAEFRDEMRSEGRSRSDLPKTFSKTRTRNHRNPIGTSVSPKSALSSIFEHGAKPHTIPGSGSSGFGRGWPTVRHPGMAARPFIGPVFDAAKDEAEDAVADELFKGIR